MNIPVIELKKLSVQFSGERILDDVSLSINLGAKVVIIGPSGQGKTVLLKTIATLIEPTSGTVFFRGREWRQLSREAQQNELRKMGMLFQKNALFDSMTVADNIAFPLRETTTLSDAEIKAKVEEFLEAVGILSSANLYPDEISGGMQKRLGIARALALDPEIIFYDDPTAGLDPITSKKIIELIIGLQKKNNSTVIVVTNDMNRAFQVADDIYMVVDRQVLHTGGVSQTKNHPDPRVQQFIRGKADGPLQGLSKEFA